MLLQDKVAAIYGAGGPLGTAIARAFAAEGARIYLAGSSVRVLGRLANEIGAAGAGSIDAANSAVMDAFAQAIVADAGRIDIAVNAIGTPRESAAGVDRSDVHKRTDAVVAQTVARHMTRQGFGVFLTFSPDDTAAGERELGKHGIRVLQIRPHAIAEAAEGLRDGTRIQQLLADVAHYAAFAASDRAVPAQVTPVAPGARAEPAGAYESPSGSPDGAS